MLSGFLCLLVVERNHVHERTIDTALCLGTGGVVTIGNCEVIRSVRSGAPSTSPALVDMTSFMQIPNLQWIGQWWAW